MLPVTRFTLLLSRAYDIDVEASLQLFKTVVTPRYAEPHRHYHTLEHIEDCLATMDEHLPKRFDVFEIELALWFHDIVCVPAASDNEEKSVLLWGAEAARVGVPQQSIDLVSDHIWATDHKRVPKHGGEYVVDVDLSILGAPASKFDRYERQVRAEYIFVDVETYCRVRKNILEKFLVRNSIYCTPEFRAEFEEGARANLTRSIASLSLGHPFPPSV